MKKYTIGLLTIAFIMFAGLLSCSKKTDTINTSQNPLLGAWGFTNEYSIFNHFDNTDSINVIFDNTNHYEFRVFNNPVDKGSYTITDSSLVMVPADTTYSSFYTITHFTMVYSYQSRASFASDKYYFSKPAATQLLIKRVWSVVNNSTIFFTENFVFRVK